MDKIVGVDIDDHQSHFDGIRGRPEPTETRLDVCAVACVSGVDHSAVFPGKVEHESQFRHVQCGIVGDSSSEYGACNHGG